MDPQTLLDAVSSTGQGSTVHPNDDRLAGTIVFEVEITNTATVQFDAAAYDGGNEHAVQVTNLNDGSRGTDVTASGLYRLDATGLENVTPNVSSYTSGNVTVKAVARIG